MGKKEIIGEIVIDGTLDLTNATVTGLPSSGGTADTSNCVTLDMEAQTIIGEKKFYNLIMVAATAGGDEYSTKIAVQDDYDANGGGALGIMVNKNDWETSGFFKLPELENEVKTLATQEWVQAQGLGGGSSKSFTIKTSDLTSINGGFLLTSDCLTRLTAFASTIDNAICFEWAFSSSKAYFAGTYEVGTFAGFHGFHLFSATPSTGEMKVMSLNLYDGLFSGNTSALNSILYGNNTLTIKVLS